MTSLAPAAGLGVAGWLSLAATPTFAVMALITAPHAGPMRMCGSAPADFPLGGMATMYLLMSAFHLPPWLRRFRGGRSVRRSHRHPADDFGRPIRLTLEGGDAASR